jgi:hypothetical protein
LLGTRAERALFEHQGDAADDIADQVVEDGHEHIDARAHRHQDDAADGRRPEDVPAKEVEIVGRDQVAHEALDVAPQPRHRRRRPQGEAGEHDDQVQARVEQQRELQDRKRLDPA